MICSSAWLARQSLLVDAAGRDQGQVEMAPGVVADQVSGGDNLLDERRLGLGVAADQKEGCAHVAAGQKFEQARRPVGIGTVVEGERQLAGARRGDERGTEELRAGP